jgi:hypothetical protein
MGPPRQAQGISRAEPLASKTVAVGVQRMSNKRACTRVGGCAREWTQLDIGIGYTHCEGHSGTKFVSIFDRRHDVTTSNLVSGFG